MELNYKAIGERIKKGREILGISQQELGKRVNLSTTAIALYESGEREIKNLELLNDVAIKLHLSLKELIEGYDETPVHISFRASKDALEDPKFVESLKKAMKKANESNK